MRKAHSYSTSHNFFSGLFIEHPSYLSILLDLCNEGLCALLEALADSITILVRSVISLELSVIRSTIYCVFYEVRDADTRESPPQIYFIDHQWFGLLADYKTIKGFFPSLSQLTGPRLVSMISPINSSY